MAGRVNNRFPVLVLAARTVTLNSDVFGSVEARGLVLLLDIDTVTGTLPTLDIKVQAEITPGGDFFDINGASFAQKIDAGQDALRIFPGLTELANKKISDVMPSRWRVVATIGGTTPSFTFGLYAESVL